jgi:type I restriction enzyme S subunit
MKLLEHFKELSLHPENAEQLKGLILQLAIQGKLTANWRQENPDLEPASELLKRIEAEKKKLIAEKKIKKEKTLPPVENDEMPYELPEGWAWCRLIDISSITGGFAFKSENYVDEGVRVIRISDFDEHGFKNHKVVRHVYTDELFQYVLEDRNILIAMTGGTVGKSLFVNHVNETMVVNQRVATIKIIQPIFEAYVNCVIPTRLIQDVIEEAKNSTNDNISMSDIKGFNIPLPTLKEQKAIVEVVNTLFTDVEQLESLTKERILLKESFVVSALARLTEAENTQQEWNFLQQHFSSFFTEKKNIKSLRETILQLAVQGKLTEGWRANNPNTEPASELLKRIEAEKQQLIAEKKIKKEKTLPPVEDDEIPYELPEGWVWCRMGQIAEKLGAGSTPTGGKSAYVDKGIMFFRSQNIYNHYLKLQDVALIPELTHEKMKGTKVKPKDILLNITGGSIGRCALIPDNFTTANVSQHVAIVRMIELETREYIHQFVISPGFQDRIMDVQVGVSREGLSMTKLKMFPTPLPSLEEQKVIVEKVNSLMAFCDELEQQIEASNIQIEQLMESCLKEVFEHDSN